MDDELGKVDCSVLVLRPIEGVKLVVSEVETLVAIGLTLVLIKVVDFVDVDDVNDMVVTSFVEVGKVGLTEVLCGVVVSIVDNIVLIKVVDFVVVDDTVLEKVVSLVLVLIKVVGFVVVVDDNVLDKVVNFVVVVDDDVLERVESFMLVVIKVVDFVVVEDAML